MAPEQKGRIQGVRRAFYLGFKFFFLVGLGAAAYFLIIWLVWSRGEWMSKQLMAKAGAKLQHNDYLGSIQDYESVIETYPKSSVIPDAHYWKGLVSYLYLDDPERAVISFKKVIEKEAELGISGNHLSAREYLAEIYEKKLHRPSEAIATYEGIIANSEDADQILQSRYKTGEVYFDMGDMAQARVEWDLLVERSPESPWAPAALYRKGGTYFVTGACKQAVEVYQTLYTGYPEDPMSVFAKFRTANCLEMDQQPTQALEIYKELEGKYPDTELIKKKMRMLNQLIQASS